MRDHILEVLSKNAQFGPDLLRVRETLTACCFIHDIRSNTVCWGLRMEDGSIIGPRGIDLPDGEWAAVGYRQGLILKRILPQSVT